MSANLEFWSKWADILSLLVAILSLVLAIIAWICPDPNHKQILKRIKPILPYIFIAALSFWVGTRINIPGEVSSSPPVSLISIRYEIGEYNPRQVDLRTASTSGISVSAGQALRLFDLWFSSTEDAALYKVQAEIYANGKLIGSTTPVPLMAGQTKLDNIKIENYNNGSYLTSWSVQPDWKDLQVFLVTYLDGKVVNRSLTIIHLAADGTAWYIGPPNLSYVSIVYSVNDGPEFVLDFRDTETIGLNAGPGDILTLKEIWYDSNASCQDCSVLVEATLLAPGELFDKNTYQTTPPNIVQRGIHKLNFAPLSWTIPSNKRFIDLTLYRNDRTILDDLTLSLK